MSIQAYLHLSLVKIYNKQDPSCRRGMCLTEEDLNARSRMFEAFGPVLRYFKQSKIKLVNCSIQYNYGIKAENKCQLKVEIVETTFIVSCFHILKVRSRITELSYNYPSRNKKITKFLGYSTEFVLFIIILSFLLVLNDLE